MAPVLLRRKPQWAENRKPHSGPPLSRRLGYHPDLPVDLKGTPLHDLYRPFEDVALLDSFVGGLVPEIPQAMGELPEPGPPALHDLDPSAFLSHLPLLFASLCSCRCRTPSPAELR